MRKTIIEERKRIISLFGLNEQEEIIKITPLEKFKKIKFYDKNMKPIEFTADEQEMVISKVGDVMSDGSYGDNAVVRAAVSIKGGKDEPLIKFGSFATDSEVIDRKTIFDDEGDFVNDGDNMRDYFEIVMSGPDIDDYKITRVRAEEFDKEKDDEEMEKEVKTEPQPEQEPVKEQPFEEEMKQKEKKGLASLLDGNVEETSNNFTKRQKKVLEKLKGEGYLLNRPENTEGYTKKKVTSKEFTESFNVWEPKK
jgi:hypothetical protein